MVGDMVWENLNENAMPLLEGVILMNDYTPVSYTHLDVYKRQETVVHYRIKRLNHKGKRP